MKRKNNNYGKFMFLLIISIPLFLIMPIVFAPPTPHTLNGYIFVINSSNPPSNLSQTSLGTKYSINNSNSGYFKQSKTALAPLPGYYSESVSGTDGDNITILAWNNINYSERNITLLGTMRGVNLTLNLTRDSEPTVNITYPLDNSLRNDSDFFTVISNLSFFGQTTNNCIAQIIYSNTSVLSSYNNQATTISLGTLIAGYSQLITWNISGIGIGSSNVSVNFTCDNMPVRRFETLTNFDTLINITIKDTTAPNITLLYPSGINWINTLSVQFSYIVQDNSNLENCSLYVDGNLKQTEITPIRNITLYFTELLNEGINFWNITCTDASPENYAGYSITKNISIDSVAPVIILSTPTNTTRTDNGTINFSYNIFENASGINNCSLLVNNTILFTDYNTNGTMMHTQSFSPASYYWQVECYDYAGNYNISEIYYFDIIIPDLKIGSSDIYFEYTSLVEGNIANVSANISNIGTMNATNVVVRFYLGDPDISGVQIGDDKLIAFIDSSETVTLKENFTLAKGINSIYVVVDPPIATNGSIVELNESNNKANNSISISSWQVYYGNKNYLLALGTNSIVYLIWNINNSLNLLFSETQTTFDWTRLQALGRDINNNTALNDFSEADTALNLTGYYDSIYELYTTLGNPIKTLNYSVAGNDIIHVPVAESTNNTNFYTGILWDTTDGGLEYDGSQDLIFITHISGNAEGKYGHYNYEARVPATLKDYKLNSGTITIYSELV